MTLMTDPALLFGCTSGTMVIAKGAWRIGGVEGERESGCSCGRYSLDHLIFEYMNDA